MKLRIGALDVTPTAGGYGIAKPDFGRAGDPERIFSVTVRIYGSSNSDMRSKLSALAAELTRDTVTIVAYTTGGGAATAIALTGAGRQPWEQPFDALVESRSRAEVAVSLKVEPWTKPANRVFLAAPIGVEWPSSSDVARTTSGGGTASSYVYAEDGRWYVTADGTRTGVLQLYGACTAAETLIADITGVWALDNAASFDATITYLNSGGGTVAGGSPSVFTLSAVGRTRIVTALTVPVTAVRFRIDAQFTTNAGACTAYFESIEVGVRERVAINATLETPGEVELTSMPGDSPSPIDVWVNADTESDAHCLYMGVMPLDGDYIFEAEALTWVGEGDNYSTNAAFYPGTGNTGWVNDGVNEARAYIDTSRVHPGTYLLLARGCLVGTGTATFSCDESSVGATGVQTTLATPNVVSLGYIVLPSRRVYPGTAANITVRIVANGAAGAAAVDRYILIPLSLGGYAYYHNATTSTGYVSQFNVEDGVVMNASTGFTDLAVDMTYAGGGPMFATKRDRLIIYAEEVGSDETTHQVDVTVYARPRFALWR